jgi:hypothetical protein
VTASPFNQPTPATKKGDAMAPETQLSGGLGPRLLAAAQRDSSWLVRMGDGQRRLTTDEIVAAYNDRRIQPDTYVWTETMQSWRELQEVDVLVDALHEEAARSADATPAASAPGTRDDSAIFSLAMLVARPAQPSEAARDDSGLIDLAGLAAAATPAPAASVAVDAFSGGGLFPLEAPAPSAPLAEPPKAKSARGVVFGLIAAVVVLASALAFQIARSVGAPTAPSASPALPIAAASASPEESVAAPPAPADHEAAVASSSTPADGSAVPTPAPSASQRPTRSHRATPPPIPSASAAPKGPKGRTKGACPCKPDDLACNMQCAVR